MNRRLLHWPDALLVLVFVLAACGRNTPAPPTMPPQPTDAPVTLTAPPPPTPTEAAQPLYLSIFWHQHQPVYFKDPETGIYAKPWVRVHATKDYVDMAAILKQYPDIHATFNLTPSLIRQLDDLAVGAKDLYWVMAEIPADQLTNDQKQFILDRFFDSNRKIVARFPRYQELLQKRDNSSDPLKAYTTDDFRDLQVLFNLAWVDPDWLSEQPLADLVAKGQGFAEEDKAVLFAEHLRLIKEVVPLHKELQDSGQIEITTTPFAHPILPLLVSTNLAKIALPDIDLGGASFAYGQDAVAQVRMGVELYEEHFGRPPRGMWPAEGSVAQEIVPMVANHGIQWIASDEGVLANSLGFTSFTRDAKEVVNEASQLYRPYYVQGSRGDPVAIVFRDVVISDKVGFQYSGVPGSEAASDFIGRIHAIREKLEASGEPGPFLVSVILDGENAWEYYDNDGKEFLHSLYQGLSADPSIQTVTPSEFLAIAPDQPTINSLWAGSWISHDFSTWIGEEEENRGWDYLARTREVLLKYEQGTRQASQADLEKAQTLMYIAEGSDWFWWYGADQNSGTDETFDQQFRDTLKQVYLALEEEPPSLLDVPIIPQQSVSADRASTGLITPTIDGLAAPEEWEAGGLFVASGGVMASADPFFKDLAYGFDSKNLYLNLSANRPYNKAVGESHTEVYLSTPDGGPANFFSRNGALLGFSANYLVDVSFEEGQLQGGQVFTAAGEEDWGTPTAALEQIASRDGTLELAIPLDLLGGLDAGDKVNMRAFYNQEVRLGESSSLADIHLLPGTGPATISVPDLGTTTLILNIEDPAGDDYGPGSYTYPTDGVFSPGNFDVLNFQVGYDEENVTFRFTLAGPVDNPWGSPNGLSVQTLDVYIDQDGDGQGGTGMLPGRNLSFQEGFAWDFALTAEGWNPAIFTPGAGGPQNVAGPGKFTILTDSSQQKVTIRVPKTLLGENPQDWRYAAAVLSQDGFPASGVMRVRDVEPQSSQWRVGGAPTDATNHTRVIDLVWPEEGQQETWLSDFTPSNSAQGELQPENFARVPMFEAD